MTTYEDVVTYALRKSFFYPASEIYANAPAGFYDFGPYGAALRRKIVQLWRKQFVQRNGFLEIEGAIIMPEDVFKASGHLSNFNDPMTKCAKCGAVHRADKILTDATGTEYKEAMDPQVLTDAIRQHKVLCPSCKKGELSDVKKSSLMVTDEVGASGKAQSFMRPESCQTIFINWQRMMKTMRVRLPQGISQAGIVYRNEISPRQTLVRSVEFMQNETEVFFNPDKIDEIDGWEEVESYKVAVMREGKSEIEHISCADLVGKKIVSGRLIAYYLARTQQLYEAYGFPMENMRFRQLDSDERAFYAKEAYDFEVKTGVGWLEIIANNYRTDYDLKGHMAGSKQDLQFVMPDGKKFIPHVYEISIGTNRTLLALLELHLRIAPEKVVLALPNSLAPVEVAVFPLLSNKPELTTKAEEVFTSLQRFDAFYDDSGSIGKRYARMDEIGCPYCVTIDFDSLQNQDATIRDRDSASQKRIPLAKLKETLQALLEGTSRFASL